MASPLDCRKRTGRPVESPAASREEWSTAAPRAILRTRQCPIASRVRSTENPRAHRPRSSAGSETRRGAGTLARRAAATDQGASERLARLAAVVSLSRFGNRGRRRRLRNRGSLDGTEGNRRGRHNAGTRSLGARSGRPGAATTAASDKAQIRWRQAADRLRSIQHAAHAAPSSTTARTEDSPSNDNPALAAFNIHVKPAILAALLPCLVDMAFQLIQLRFRQVGRRDVEQRRHRLRHRALEKRFEQPPGRRAAAPFAAAPSADRRSGGRLRRALRSLCLQGCAGRCEPPNSSAHRSDPGGFPRRSLCGGGRAHP